MKVEKKELPKSQLELTVELSADELRPYVEKAAQKVSEEVKIEGFRPGKVPPEILKQKIGEMTILEEAANIAIRKTIDQAIEENTTGRQAIGQPQVNVTKLAPENPLEYKVVVDLLPTVTLGKYKDLGIKPEEARVSAEELDKSLQDLREMRAEEKSVERGAASGDKITADIHLFVGGVQQEDGHHHDLAVILGKEYFVPGFDDQLLGAKKGEQKKFSLPYPDNHHQKNLAGKLVEFEVKVKEVFERVLPVLDDAFASFFKLESLESLKKNLEDSLLAERKQRADQKSESELISKIIDGTKFGDMPDALVNAELRNMIGELQQNVERQGGKFEDYLQHIKKDRGALMLELTPNAIKRVKSALVMRELVVAEKIEVSEQELDEKLAALKKQYAGNEEVMKMFSDPGYRRYLSNALANDKMMAKLKEWNYASAGAK